MFQHTAARRRLALAEVCERVAQFVSTHSRPKAAGEDDGNTLIFIDVCFNTQPPEGGWKKNIIRHAIGKVSTHSRPKAAGPLRLWRAGRGIGFNTQPPEGGWNALHQKGRTF